jgi:hypothetical protein
VDDSATGISLFTPPDRFPHRRFSVLGSTGVNAVSKDGKTVTWTSKGINAQGQPTSGVQVFEKQ